jgi:hypothetical protein
MVVLVVYFRQRKPKLEFDLPARYQQLEKFEMAHDLNAVATTVLIPLAQPQQRNDFFRGETALREGFGVSCYDFSSFNSFFRLNLRVHNFFLPE